jgi:glucose/arabinose dehydrogenase
MLVTLDANRPVDYEIFAEGWLQGNKARGRPVDILIMPDGALLVSDDRAGAIYRISYPERK